MTSGARAPDPDRRDGVLAADRAPKHIGLNVLWLVPGVVGGSEEYTTRLLVALAALAPTDLTFTLFANSSFAAVYPDLLEAFPSVTAPVSGRSKPLRVLAETTWLGAQLRPRRVELMHHLGGILPTWRPTPCVLTIHDLQPLAMPAHFRIDKRMFNGFVVPRSVHVARDIVTLTDFTEGDLERRCGVEPDRIVVVAPGFDQPRTGNDPAEQRRVRERYGIGDRPFFVFPAITYPHKNHVMLLRAFAKLTASHPDTVLVLTGGEAHMEDEVRMIAQSLGIAERVKRTGRIPASDLDALYREAAGLTFPSLYEGFGLPVLEAMSRDCPVIAADATALPEVVQDAGLLVPPEDTEGWSRAMAALLDDDLLRVRLIAAGRERARHYDWGQSARALAEVYRRAPIRSHHLPRPTEGREVVHP